MNKPTQTSLEDASPCQLAYLALNGSYGEKLVARLLLESLAQPSGITPLELLEAAAKNCDHKFIDSDHCIKCGWVPTNPNTDVVQPFPLGRWTAKMLKG